MERNHHIRGFRGPGKVRRANVRIVVFGLAPPLLLMVLATVLDRAFASIDRNPLIHTMLVYGSWISALVVVAVLFKALYLPWLLRDRPGVWNRALRSLAPLLIIIVYISGYPWVALALALMGVVVVLKEGGEVSRFRRRRRSAEGDEASWYYVGEGPATGEGPAAGKAPGRTQVADEDPGPGGDPWLVLGLPRGAGPEEIKAAYRRIIKECHPDLNGGVGDSARFRLASEAYERLTG